MKKCERWCFGPGNVIRAQRQRLLAPLDAPDDLAVQPVGLPVQFETGGVGFGEDRIVREFALA